MTDAPGQPLCRAPATQLHFDPAGHVAVCSKSTHRHLGHILDGDLHALWRGPGLAAVRDALAHGRFPAGCEMCAWHVEQGNVDDHPARSFDARPLPTDPDWPAHLEFAFSNRCNLACVHCSPELSSTIRARRGLPPQRSPYDDRFFAQIEPFVAHAQSLSFLGGEPFLQPEFFRLLDLLIAAGRCIPVHVTTNGTVFDARVERVLGHLPVQISVSIDGVAPATIERIRVGADAAELLENARRFARVARLRHREFTLNFSLMRENWRELPDLFLLARELGARVWVVPVTHPEELSLFTLPARECADVARTWREREAEVLAATDADAASQRNKWSSLVAMVERVAAAGAPPGVWHEAPAARATGAQALELLARMTRLEQEGDGDGARHAAAAAELAALAAAASEEIAAAFPDGPQVRAWRLAETRRIATALAVAACTPPHDPLFARSLLFRAGLHFNRREGAAGRALLEEAERAGGRTPEWWMRKAWLDLDERQLAAGRDALAQGEASLVAAPDAEPWLVSEFARARMFLRQFEGEQLLAPRGAPDRRD